MAAWFPYDVHILIISLLAVVWYHFKNAYRRFSDANIPSIDPLVPLGNITKSTFRLRHITDDVCEAYNKFPDHKYVGFYQLDKSFILLRDPEMIKQIAVKDFDNFLNHQTFISEDVDPLFGKNLFSLTGNKWRDMRSTLSPGFTGSKMKNMFSLMYDCGRQVNEYLMGEISKNSSEEKQCLTLEFKDLCTRYTSDVIATTAFGIKVDSLNEKDNEFYRVGIKSTLFDGIFTLKIFGYVIFPKIMEFLKIRLFSEETSNFYRKLVQDTMKVREQEGIYRPDMIHLLMEAKKGNLKYDEHEGEKSGFATVEEASENNVTVKRKWEADDLTAQALSFFLAGFDKVANLMCFLLYELSVDPNIQKRLHDEIDSTIEEIGENLTYSVLQELTYLDMVVSETLRKWPPSIISDRACNKQYNLPPSKEGYNDGIKVLPNDIVWLPIYPIHRDPKYWPNPGKFDPERFSDENKGNIKQYTYIPFGAGPRNCIGSRYALMEAKVLIYSLMSKFHIKLDEKKTSVPLQLCMSSFNLKAKNGFWMILTPRK